MNTIEVGGVEEISIIESWKAWRKIKSCNSFEDLPNIDPQTCDRCYGRGDIMTKEYGHIRCLHTLKYIENHVLSRNINFYESAHMKHEMEEFTVWGKEQSRSITRSTKDVVIKWIEKPNSWLTMVGNPGTGKSLLLSIINTELRPWSLYVTFPDLEQKIFESMSDENGLQLLVDRISRHPILLLDDVGSDYGSEFARSAMRKIIDLRYRLYDEFPTVIATNLGPTEMAAYDKRIGDRVFDKTRNQIITLKEVLSYRKHGAE